MSTGHRANVRRIPPVDESILRMVENLACRLAEISQGRLTPCHLMPYVPLPLELIRTCLDDMVDGESVVSPPGEEKVVYEFTAYRDVVPGASGVLSTESCVACGASLLPKMVSVLCVTCAETLYRAAASSAMAQGWGQQAQTEHALLYAAAPYAGEPVSIATLASRSHSRMRATRLSVEKMALEGYLHQDADLKTGALVYTFPHLAYPRALYETNASLLRTWAGTRGMRRWQKGRQWLYRLGLVMLLGGMTTWYLWPPAQPPRPLPRSAVLPESPRHEPRSVPVPADAPPAPPYGKAYHEEAMKHATPIPVSIRRDGFTPVEMKVTVSWNTSTPLSPTPPARIIKHPVYQGSSQRYGTLRLGTGENPLYDFVFDLISGPHPIVYFDANQNGDLSDDGKALTNQGSGIFATVITLPFRRLIREVSFPGTYALWFFTNDSLWKRYATAHYSRTQLKGTVHIAGKAYVAYIADAGNNDVDLTNDGVSVDLNGDGDIDRHQEYFPPNKVAHIHGKDYAFVITW